ncbi:MAG: D-glycero-beta-D-manno-heptose 1-phosphate adenylyltransferase [Candidatus Aminicenantes bacterium]|jgi:D-beta-D-heptose 7-phosphate kinase/D-beta-D-heptose 1-phosphate adenosyltransferase
MNDKIKKLDELKKLREEYRSKGKTVVFTNGCFDVLHSGHIHLFRQAKEYGDILIVAVNDDRSVRSLKGAARPVFPLEERLEVLEAIQPIDHLISFAHPTPRNLIQTLLPDVLVKGGDWKPDEVVGREEVEGAGGKVVIIPYLSGRSSSKILEKIKIQS